LQPQADTREFAAGGGFGERLKALAGMRGDAEFDVFQAVRGGLTGKQAGFEGAALHGELLHGGRHRLIQAAGGIATQLAQLPGQLAIPGFGFRLGAPQGFQVEGFAEFL